MMPDKKRLKSHHDSMDVLDKLALGPKKLSRYLEDNNVKPKKSSCIYVHVPFCNKICTFCSLRRTLSSPSEDYHTHIIREIEEYSKLEYIQNTVFDAIYFGGGNTYNPLSLRP